jgi:predicted ATP-dependent endonuclease of OLD family
LQDVFLVLLDQERAFRVIEEPEAHLYPMAQKHLIEMIAMMLNSTDSQVIITTHSPYILSIFNNLLFATRVVNKDEKVRGQVDQIIPESCRLDPKKCNAYFLKDGLCKSIFNPKLGLIGQNHLDEISEELGADFDDLYRIYGELLK